MRTPGKPRCWTDASQQATLLWHRLHRHGVGCGAVVKLAGERDRCRAHLLRLQPRLYRDRDCRPRRPSPRALAPVSNAPVPAHPTPTACVRKRRLRLPGRPAGRPGRRTRLRQTSCSHQRQHNQSTAPSPQPRPHRRIDAVPEHRSQPARARRQIHSTARRVPSRRHQAARASVWNARTSSAILAIQPRWPPPMPWPSSPTPGRPPPAPSNPPVVADPCPLRHLRRCNGHEVGRFKVCREDGVRGTLTLS